MFIYKRYTPKWPFVLDTIGVLSEPMALVAAARLSNSWFVTVSDSAGGARAAGTAKSVSVGYGGVHCAAITDRHFHKFRADA